MWRRRAARAWGGERALEGLTLTLAEGEEEARAEGEELPLREGVPELEGEGVALEVVEGEREPARALGLPVAVGVVQPLREGSGEGEAEREGVGVGDSRGVGESAWGVGEAQRGTERGSG